MPNSSQEVNPDLEEIFSEIRNLDPYTPLPEKLKLLKALVPTLALMTNLEEAARLDEVKEWLRLRAKDLDALRADIKAARSEREEKEKRRQGKAQEICDLQEVLRLHPAIDFPSDAMIIGFRADLTDNGTGLVLVISDSQGVRYEINPEPIEVEGRLYQVMKNISPPLLSDVWGVTSLKAFLERPTMPANLYGGLVGAFKTYLDLTEPAYGLMAAWTVGTYFAQLFTAFPFLHFYGPKESGKSKSLEALQCVCFNAWKGRDITAAALGDATEAQRGTVLLDQAEKLNSDKEGGTLIGLLADSYKKAGGKRRVVDTSKGRKCLEFSTYGPKAFASTKNLDPDLADRVVSIPMTRTRRQLPDLEGWEPIWAELRDKLYRFALTAHREVRARYGENSGNGKRIGELWRPILAVLLALGVSETEIEAVRRLFMSAAKETRHEATPWECALLEALRDEAQTHVSPFHLTVGQIIKAMNLREGEQPGGNWVGNTLSHYHLYQAKKRVGKTKETTYQFDPAKVIDLCILYLREDGTGDGGEKKHEENPQDDVSIAPTQDNAYDSHVTGRAQENGWIRQFTPFERELFGDLLGGREGTCPPEMTCPPYPTENAAENDGGREGHEKSGDIAKEIFPDLLEGEL